MPIKLLDIRQTDKSKAPASKSPMLSTVTTWKRPGPFLSATAALALALGAHAQSTVSSQGSEAHALQIIQTAVQAELAAAQNDHSHWTYIDHDKTDEHDTVAKIVETPQGAVHRTITKWGRPLSPEEQQKEQQENLDFANDPAAQEKQRKAGEHDDQQARAMLRMLPNAFIWRTKSETPQLVTLSFTPDPAFHPPNMEAKVMATMAGELVVARPDNRIRTLRGTLTDDVRFAGGLFGRLHKGGVFDVERREVAPHLWQITETRVHIYGKALLFKTIGQQDDEIKTDFKPSTANTLDEAAKQLASN